MFLVDDDQPQMGERQKETRPRAHHHPRAARAHGPPGGAPLGQGHLRMPQHRRRAEALHEALKPLGGERDLGEHDQHLSLRRAGQQPGDRFEIDFRLPRARDAVEKKGRIMRRQCRRGRSQGVGGFLLLRRERRRRPARIGRIGGRARLFAALRTQQAIRDHAAHDALAHTGRARKRRHRPFLRRFPLEHLQHLAARRRQADGGCGLIGAAAAARDHQTPTGAREQESRRQGQPQGKAQ